MNKINEEYLLYKKLCKNRSIRLKTDELTLVESLKKKGLSIIYKDGFYELTEDISILSESEIRSDLGIVENSKIDKLKVIFKTGSTNHKIVNYSINEFYTVLVAEYQSKGQGRRQKKWQSPLGANLYFSVQFHLNEMVNIAFIPLIVARSICNALSDQGINNCKIKWPNDIYLDGKKIAGVLSESRYCNEKGFIIVVGIGININMYSEQKIDQEWSSIKISQNKNFNRNTILSSLLSRIIPDFDNISEFNFERFKQDWDFLDFLKDKSVCVLDDNVSYTAIATGLADDGALIVLYKNKFRKIYSGEVSIKVTK
ncbi:MAG: biotin--[acetyl-CoA-carboxylase] ligase [gamma proteobacterium symbiont of Taylorina sp.]|nr:biotin--[acetyl-CoA-carboxylase] ligase [gamma proteobacterium symbiont of Taylorina sp.]